MAKRAAITIRVPAPLKKRLEARARRQHRSLAAQVISDLEAVVDMSTDKTTEGRFVGMYGGRRVPSDADVAEIRALLWGKLGQHHDSHG